MTMVILNAGRQVAHSPNHACPPLDPIQLHAEAHNALAMALHYVRQPEVNVLGAARKAVQALAALRRLDGTQGGAA